jgi:two-component system, LytTR family, sensor kinase
MIALNRKLYGPMGIPLINKKWGLVLLHVAAWLVVFSLPYLLFSHYTLNRPKNPDSEGFFYLNTITGLFWIATFYLNMYVLTPRFIYKRKYLLYFALLAGIFCFIMVIHRFLFAGLITTVPFIFLNSLWFNLPTFILTVAVSTTFRFANDKAKTDTLTHQKHEENLKTELSFLRSQISPHFIFNVLNNMVALVRMKSNELEPTIMKLSSLMQYMLYETDDDKVLIKRETEYLQSYIDLQQQRFGYRLSLHTSFNVKDDWYSIEPMLLIPFVENAFKHGVGQIEDPQIDIELFTEKDMLHFFIRNKYNPDTTEPKDKISGIGLANVKRRLNLLYGNQQHLTIEKSNNWFSVRLQLKLH